MRAPDTTPYAVAARFIGTHEIPGAAAQPFLSWCLSLCGQGPTPSDEIPNCSAFMNGIGTILGLPITESAAARSWLSIGDPVSNAPLRGYDIAILSRGPLPQPDATVRAAQGHVGLFSAWDPVANRIQVLGANQHDSVNLSWFDASRVLAIRRWWPV